MFVNLAVEFADLFLRDQIEPIDGTKSSEHLLVLSQLQQVDLCIGVCSAILPEERRCLDEITEPFQLNEKRSTHWHSLRIFNA